MTSFFDMGNIKKTAYIFSRRSNGNKLLLRVIYFVLFPKSCILCDYKNIDSSTTSLNVVRKTLVFYRCINKKLCKVDGVL